MIPGNLYKCSDYYLLLYPTKEAAGAARAAAANALHAAVANSWSNHLTKELGYPISVSYIEKNNHFFVVDCINDKNKSGEEFQYLHVIYKNKVGWIVWRDWLKLRK